MTMKIEKKITTMTYVHSQKPYVILHVEKDDCLGPFALTTSFRIKRKYGGALYWTCVHALGLCPNDVILDIIDDKKCD